VQKLLTSDIDNFCTGVTLQV